MVVELLTGALFGACYLLTDSLWVAVVNALLMAVLVVLTFIDLDTQLIPDRLHLIIIALALLKWFYLGWSPVDVFLGAIIVSVPMLLLSYFFNAFGGGDVKLMFAAGLFLGWVSTLVAFIIGVLLGGLMAMWLLWRKRVGGKSMIAFGPYLAIGIAVAVWFGLPIAQWYVSLLG
jgi:leader peptidase (prepilin peptidase) / N-methyltransferase